MDEVAKGRFWPGDYLQGKSERGDRTKEEKVTPRRDLSRRSSDLEHQGTRTAGTSAPESALDMKPFENAVLRRLSLETLLTFTEELSKM